MLTCCSLRFCSFKQFEKLIFLFPAETNYTPTFITVVQHFFFFLMLMYNVKKKSSSSLHLKMSGLRSNLSRLSLVVENAGDFFQVLKTEKPLKGTRDVLQQKKMFS